MDGGRNAAIGGYCGAGTDRLHQTLVHKFFIKAMNGYHHSKAFTLQNYCDRVVAASVSESGVEMSGNVTRGARCIR